MPGGVRTLAGSAVAPIRLTDLPTDGRPATVQIDLPAVAFQVEAGSRIEVDLATTDQAYAGPTAPAVYRIGLAAPARGPAIAGALLLPEVGGIRVSAGEVPVGTLIALIVLVVLVITALVLLGRVRARPHRIEAGITGANQAADLSAGGRADAPALAPPPLEIVGLGKSYPGGVAAVTDVSFRVETGQVLGLLGPNGAGKTTTLRMVMGLITPTAGQIRVFGQLVSPGAGILARVGSFVEGSGFLPHLSGAANLELYWRATGRPTADAHLAEALEIAGLGRAIDRRVKTYSQGMRQRLAIAQAMLGLPDLLLLDEPTNGLDPPQIHAMREVLRGYAASGRTVLISSHMLSEVEQTCSHVVVVHQGRTIAAGTVSELVATSGDMVFAVGSAAQALEVLRGLPGIGPVDHDDPDGSARGGAGLIRADLGSCTAAQAIAALVTAGVEVTSAAPRNRLEDVFLELVGASGPSSTPGSASASGSGSGPATSDAGASRCQPGPERRIRSGPVRSRRIRRRPAREHTGPGGHQMTSMPPAAHHDRSADAALHAMAGLTAPAPAAPSGVPVGFRTGRTLPVRVELARQLRRRRTQLSLGFMVALPIILWGAFSVGQQLLGRRGHLLCRSGQERRGQLRDGVAVLLRELPADRRHQPVLR